MEWLINRRRMMFNKSTPPAYVTFADPIVWTTMCERYGDYDEVVITDNGDDTVDIVTTYKSMRNGSLVKSVVTDTQTNVDNSGGTYTAGTTKRMIGISKRQCAAVTSFPNKVFKSNTSITSFDELIYFTSLHSIGEEWFDMCSNLESIDFSNITTLGKCCFRNCSKLVPKNMSYFTSVATSALNNTAIEYIDISNFSTLPVQAWFTGCTKLVTVVLSPNITSIPNNYFLDCINLENVNLNDNITSIGSDVFQKNNKLKIYKLPNSLQSLGAQAFNNCSNLQYIGALNTALQTYGRDQVRKGSTGTPKLIGVTLPSTVTSVGLGNYAYTPKFLRVYATAVPTATDTVMGGSAGSGVFQNIYVPDSAVNDYKAANVWSTYASRIYPMSQWATDAQTNDWQDIQSAIVWDRNE